MSEYVAFDMEYLLDFYNVVRSNIGAIITIAIYVFLIIAGIHAVLNIVRHFT